MAEILIVDDDMMFCEMLAETVSVMGHSATYVHNLEQGLEAAMAGDFDVIFLDVLLPDGNGLEHLTRFQESPSRPEVIIVTGLGGPDGAELAVKSGAWDYIQKGYSIKAITLPLTRALRYRGEKSGTRAVSLKREGILGECPKIKACLDLMAHAAGGDANVLITGETGTGKELFARAIHENSPRSKHNFVTVDCAALPSTLVESVLFGYVKGAFTGADRDEEGLIRQANNGTLFLDEVGELPLEMQKAFLRVLQERRFRPVGGQKEMSSNFRLVAATNRDLEETARLGLFRTDLLFRLRAFTIELPPLRECLSDIRELVVFYISRLCERDQTATKGFSADFLDALLAYHWPGNVRELINTLERSLAAAAGEPTLYPKHLPPNVRGHVARTLFSEEPMTGEAPANAETRPRLMPTLHDYRESLERQYFKELIERTKGDIKTAGEISGLSRSRLYELLKKHQVAKPS